jgi:hypothetical protein
VTQPRSFNNELLTEDAEVVRAFFASTYYHHLLVVIFEKSPKNKGSGDPALPDATECLHHQSLWSVLEVISDCVLSAGRRRQVELSPDSLKEVFKVALQ